MLLLPADIVACLAPFAPRFSRPVWRHVQVLLVGAIRAAGRRMVSSALRAVGRGNLPQFQRYHRVLNRAVWSSLGASRILLGLLVATFAPSGPLVVGIDETIERRRGTKIAAAGIYRDPVRSSHSHFVKGRGLRWISLHLLVPIPWARHVSALPFLTALAPSPRPSPLARWYARRDRPLHPRSATTVWYHTGLPPVPIRWVLVRDPRDQFATQPLLCTDLAADPLQIVSWFVLRWQLEVTFREVRAHLGVETQRQWSERAIARTTPALLGLFSLVTLLAHAQIPADAPLRRSTWYVKPFPTFADALALARRRLWTGATFPTSLAESDLVNIPRTLIDHLADLLCYAA